MIRFTLTLAALPLLHCLISCNADSSEMPRPIPPQSCAPLRTVVHQDGLIPDDIEVSPDGSELWVASTDRSAVLRFDARSGTPLEPAWIESIPFPWALGFGPSAHPYLWVAESNAGKLHRLDLSTHAAETAADSLSLPMDIAFDAKGRMALCESKGAIIAFTDAWVSRYDGEVGDPSTKSILLSGLSGACDMAYAPDGSLFVAAGNSTSLIRLHENGKTETLPVHLQSPTDVMYHSSSAGLLVSQMDEVIWINPENGYTVRVACDGISHAEDLAVGPDGMVYLSESLGAEVSSFEWRPESAS